jgi:hypothetical protein
MRLECKSTSIARENEEGAHGPLLGYNGGHGAREPPRARIAFG